MSRQRPYRISDILRHMRRRRNAIKSRVKPLRKAIAGVCRLRSDYFHYRRVSQPVY